MNQNRRRVLALGLAALAARPSFAQSKYPERPIRLVIPFPPGGVNDAVGRPWAEKMKPLLGTVVVENQGGAGGVIGATAVAHAQPDGYTLLLGGGSSHVINPIAASRPTYDPMKDFEAIAILAVSGLGIVVNPALPVRTLKDLIAYARANAAKMSYASAGVGTVTHIGAELFKSLTGTGAMVHVPYKGAGPAIADVMGGQVPLAMPNLTGQVLKLHEAGKLRLLAVTTPRRLAAAPDIPTAVEAGLPGMIAQNFTALFAPAHTPAAIVEQIARATRAAMSDPEFRRQLVASGFEPETDSSPEKARAFVREEIARWTPVVKSIALKLD
ncbi:MAG TPA: tripartite tricarboxylate transporter substrate binding protein [Burkholderiales bacterium]